MDKPAYPKFGINLSTPVAIVPDLDGMRR